MVCTDWSITWSSLIPSMEFLASPIWLRSIREEVANPGVIVPGATDMAPGYGVMKPPRAWGTGNEWKGKRGKLEIPDEACTHTLLYLFQSKRKKLLLASVYTDASPSIHTHNLTPIRIHTPHTTHHTLHTCCRASSCVKDPCCVVAWWRSESGTGV